MEKQKNENQRYNECTQICQVKHNVWNTFFELQTQKKNTREVSQAFLNICEYIVETSCSTIFSKNNFILCQSWITSNNAFPFKNAKWCFAVVSVELQIFLKGERKKFLKNDNICSETSFFIINLFPEENVSFIYSIITLFWMIAYCLNRVGRALKLTWL